MKLSKLFGASALALGLAVLPAVSSVSAQDATTGQGTTQSQNYDQAGDNDGFDWGLLGLLGLAGLAGLARKNDHRDEPTRYQEPPVSSRSDYR